MRASHTRDAVTICADEPWRTARLAPLVPGAAATAGPFCCSPERGGRQVRFTRFAWTYGLWIGSEDLESAHIVSGAGSGG
ncbi:DUF1349 domain-containing protein [Streptomyces sp. CB02959]|uniref:DUF1349 domain-containing protein n=1 Tax=Streptomyces sp. CB02959 TaxID=2020330 RepID=UPI0027E43C28|nr:DUF1349 domain-containing protein [Streptomyces sp. CB02959]